MKDVTITVRMPGPLAKKLKAEPSKNRRFNNHSEVVRTLVTLYLDSNEFQMATHRLMKQRYADLMDEEL